MRRLTSLATVLVLASGCMLVFDSGGSSSDDNDGGCHFTEPDSVPSVTLRNPDTLTCDTWFGPPPCDLACGPCPQVAPSTPPPPWGFCGSECEALSEVDCAEALDCRVVKDAACAISGGCPTDFLGCFPTNRFSRDLEIDCLTARDGEICSMSDACTAFHRAAKIGSDPEARPFAMCAPEGTSPGTCFGEVTCGDPAPACTLDRRPGVSGGCYTGVCIPIDLCEPAPPQP